MADSLANGRTRESDRPHSLKPEILRYSISGQQQELVAQVAGVQRREGGIAAEIVQLVRKAVVIIQRNQQAIAGIHLERDPMGEGIAIVKNLALIDPLQPIRQSEKWW